MTLVQLATVGLIALAAIAWIAFLDHPNRNTFASAVRQTLPLL